MDLIASTSENTPAPVAETTVTTDETAVTAKASDSLLTPMDPADPDPFGLRAMAREAEAKRDAAAAETAETAQPGENPFPFDWEYRTVAINVAPATAEPHYTFHRFRRPTKAQLEKRSKDNAVVSRSVGKESELVATESPDAALYDQLIVSVAGYTRDGLATDAPDVLARVKRGQKTAAMRALFDIYAELIWSPEDVYEGTDGSHVTAEIRAGDDVFKLDFSFREPDERTTSHYDQYAQRVLFANRNSTSRIVTNLSVAEATFDKLFAGVEGGTVAGQVYREELRAQFLKSIDVEVKRAVIAPVMDAQQARLRD